MGRGWLLALATLSAGCDKLLGLGEVTPPPAPHAWKAVSAGGLHTCALEGDGSLWCWGDNTLSQLGVGAVLEADTPTQVGTAAWTQVAAGAAHTCGIQTDGSLWCWGRNQDAETGIGSHGFTSGNSRLDAFAIAPPAIYMTPEPGRVTGTWREVAVGYRFSCGIRDDGSLWCWGSDDSGQLANGETTLDRPQPLEVAAGPWSAVATGNYHVCALAQTGAISCWGYASDGALGLGVGGKTAAPVVQPTAVPVPAGAAQWLAVAAGNRATCAIAGGDPSSGGAVYCWGTFAAGASSLVPAPVMLGGAPLDGVVEVKVGGDDGAPAGPYGPMANNYDATACARRADGSAWCWGASPRGQLASGGVADSNQPAGPIQLADRAAPWTALSVGGEHACALAGDGSLACFGADARGQLGDGGASHLVPTRVPGTAQVVSAGYTATCALDAAGHASCAGSNLIGGIGDGTTIDRRAFTPIASSLALHALATANLYACALSPGQTAVCWGNNSSGQLGDGTTSSPKATPETVSAVPYAQLSANSHTCAITGDSKLYCWGTNGRGQLGNGTTTPSPTPQQVTTPATWLSVATGDEHTCALASDGKAYCWGTNTAGQLGSGDALDPAFPTPRPVTSSVAPPFVSLTTGGYHTCALGAAGDAWCWGDNHVGQLGVGGLSGQSLPRHIEGHAWSQLAAGTRHTCGIDTNGKLWCWGDNAFAQLGDGTLVASDQPVAVGDPAATWIDVTCGGFHTCARQSDGSTWCWGMNDWGQLGDGTAWRGDLQPIPAP